MFLGLFAPIVEIITGTPLILDSLLLFTNCQERKFPSKICINSGQPPLNIMDNHDEYYTYSRIPKIKDLIEK